MWLPKRFEIAYAKSDRLQTLAITTEIRDSFTIREQLRGEPKLVLGAGGPD